MGRLVHRARIGGSKWQLGRALCGCTISRWTPTSGYRREITCPRCLKRMDAEGIAPHPAGYTPLPPLPYSPLRRPDFAANEARCGTATDRCLLCGKAVILDRAKVVVLDPSLGKVIDPKTADGDTADGGCFYVGPDCWRSTPALHPYEVK